MIDRAIKSGKPEKMFGGVFGGQVYRIASAATVPDGVPVIDLVGHSTPVAVALPDSKLPGYKVTFVMSNANSGSTVVTPTNLKGGSTLTFDAAGETATLQFIGGTWYILSVKGTTVA